MSLQAKANRLIAQGALTNSKRPSTFVEGIYPTHLKRGNGCTVWDYEGKKYLDFICGLGSNILGYAQEDINKVIAERLRAGITLSLSTDEELIFAEKLRIIFPFIDCIKILKTGSEACSAAIRIARASHGKHRCLILSEGYHGFHDSFVSLTNPALGVPPHTYIRPLAKNEDSIPVAAALILEPIMTDMSQKRIDWLYRLRETCTKHGTLLIFDEVITGFRFPRYSVSSYLGIEPDIIVLGKAMANGMPISVVGGRDGIMNCGEYFVSSTFAGETLSLVAASKTMDLLKTPKYNLDDLWQKGEDWLRNFNSLWPEAIRVEGYPTRGRFDGDPLIKALFFQESIAAGLLFGPSWFFNFPLAEKYNVTLDAVKDIICRIKSGAVKLKGKLPQSPFADKVRQST